MPLPGNSVLLLDFIHGADIVCSQTSHLGGTSDLCEAVITRREAIAILGSLICFSAHYPGMHALTPGPDRELTLISCQEVKSLLVKSLLRCARKEAYTSSRCLALTCLSVFIYEELTVAGVDDDGTEMFSKVRECLNAVLSTMRMLERSPAAALVAVDIIALMCDHVHVLSDKLPEMPIKIIEFLCGSVHCLVCLLETGSKKLNLLVQNGTLRQVSWYSASDGTGMSFILSVAAHDAIDHGALGVEHASAIRCSAGELRRTHQGACVSCI